MARPTLSSKHLAINKANTQMVVAVAIASFITIFCLVATSALLSQKNYQGRVIAAKEKANTQLKANIKALGSLVASYKAFTGTSTNVLGGNVQGTGDNDGDNAKIVLDALPSKYDFPGLTSSLEKLFKDRNLSVTSITGTDDEVAQSGDTSSDSPQPVTIPFGFTLTSANYAQVQDVISTLEHSIRPIQIDTMTLSGGANNMQLTVTAHTYYQPSVALKVKTTVIK
ncbi:MAG TPA: hypothetical protein VLG13_00080 [Patescibacteria group bacterium]|nr:hypothetical protein [Patescibacteria group bacterium]